MHLAAMMPGMYEMLLQPIGNLQGVGAVLEKRLASRAIETVGDLLLHFPKGYEDDRQVAPIASLQAGE